MSGRKPEFRHRRRKIRLLSVQLHPQPRRLCSLHPVFHTIHRVGEKIGVRKLLAQAQHIRSAVEAQADIKAQHVGYRECGIVMVEYHIVHRRLQPLRTHHDLRGHAHQLHAKPLVYRGEGVLQPCHTLHHLVRMGDLAGEDGDRDHAILTPLRNACERPERQVTFLPVRCRQRLAGQTCIHLLFLLHFAAVLVLFR